MTKKGKVLGSDISGRAHSRQAFNAKRLQDFRRTTQREYEKMRHDRKTALLTKMAKHIDGLPDDEWADEEAWDSRDPATRILEIYLNGKGVVDISNAGGEFDELVKSQMSQKKRKYKDKRDRRDAIERRVLAFDSQLPLMVDAYLDWSLALGNEGIGGEELPQYQEEPEGYFLVKKIDTYLSRDVSVPLYANLPSLAASFVRQGMIPCAPSSPTVGVTLRLLEFFRSCSMRSPHMSVQAFVKTICDVHQTPYHTYLSKQFSICYDTYLDILNGVDKKVKSTLGRDDPTWRLKHACVACTYKIKDEVPMKYSMFVTMDGNDSLKRLVRRAPATEDEGGGKDREIVDRRDPRQVHGDYYLTRETVDKWSRETIEMIPHKDDKPGDPNVCDDRWKNMANDKTSRMWGIFEETGVFLSLCRHGHVLVVMDMVRSGEQSKYPLATVEALQDAFGSNIGFGYDIGCKFKTTLKNSSLGPRAEELNTKCLVGSFHGHAHNRICQLQNLATYVEGLGLEDLEGCEPFFSKSNALASSTRHASIFHRRQKINEYIKHLDNRETYLSLSSLLITSYKRALEILAGEGALLKQVHDQQLGTAANIFPEWLAEEHEYLTSLKREPIEESLKMEYYEKLQRLYKSEARLSEVLKEQWSYLSPSSFSNTPTPDSTRKKETVRRHVQETHSRDLEAVQALEHHLEIETRWLPEDEEWKEAETLVSKRRYQRAVDRLESLVVARMFELTKMNMSQTGYKMRQHIGKALKTRSQAIQTALNEFNTAAEEMGRETLAWEDVIRYSQLADFDLLSDTREDIRKRPWATPTSRQLLDQYFKIIRAREEIIRLNIEIRRLTTYIRDEEALLAAKEASLRESQPTLAHQINIRLTVLRRMNDVHLHKLRSLQKLPGFSGTLDTGISLENGIQVPALAINSQRPLGTTMDISESNLQAGDEEDEEQEEQEAGDIALKVLQVTTD